MPVNAMPISHNYLTQCIASFVGCTGFFILFNIHGPGGFLCALGGGIAWAAYCISNRLGASPFIGYFVASLTSAAYSEIMARIRKYPAISYLIVSIFPMIPGAGVYYAMNFAVRGEMELFASRGIHTLAIASVMAVGILLSSTFVRMLSDRISKKR